MSATVPITNGMMSYGAQVFQPVGGQGEAPPSAAAVGYMSQAGGEHNTPLHVGALLLFAGTVIVVFHLAGFRMGFDVGLGRG